MSPETTPGRTGVVDTDPAAPRLRRGRRVAAGTAVAVVLLASAACGTSAAGTGSSGTASSDEQTGTAQSGTAQPGGTGSDALMTCLEENGVPAPPSGGAGGEGGTPPSGAPAAAGQGGTGQAGTAPGGGAAQDGASGGPGSGQAPPGVDAEVWQKAQAACASAAG